MSEQAAKLLQQALELSEEDRAALAQALLDTVSPFQDKAIEEAWKEEIGRRINEIDSGRAKTVPWEEVNARLQQKLR